jgi:hypothetical protein
MTAKAASLIVITLAGAICCLGQRSNVSLPRIGSLRTDEPAGDGRSGCDNHDIVWSQGGEKYVFMSSSEGYQPFMNLNGHNVELELKKTTLTYIDVPFYAKAVYEYAHMGTRIIVRLTAQSDYTTYVPATIIVRRGQRSRIIHGFVAPQCDAL